MGTGGLTKGPDDSQISPDTDFHSEYWAPCRLPELSSVKLYSRPPPYTSSGYRVPPGTSVVLVNGTEGKKGENLRPQTTVSYYGEEI